MRHEYLPMHKAMLTSLELDTMVIYNGKKNIERLGVEGIIVGISSKEIKVVWLTGQRVGYSFGWFVRNIYINIESIKAMRPFKGVDYIKKYKNYVKSQKDIMLGDCVNHPTMKDEVDNCVKIDKELDTKGSFYVIDDFHNCVMSRHQTQRIAEEKAKHYADHYCSKTYTVVKAVSVAKKKSFIERLLNK